MATAVLYVVNLLFAGVVQDALYEASLTPAEFARATGNGVVPGMWILMPFISVVVLTPVWLVLFAVAAGAGRSMFGPRTPAQTPLIAFVTLAIVVVVANVLIAGVRLT